ncbi:hypothetical protein [Microbispora sp. CA-102843]|uniref:hypothetical protein n=1 Tax=Microbispora sp. CA-102843 TaxID=3239952 RepID=UPI003D8B84D0
MEGVRPMSREVQPQPQAISATGAPQPKKSRLRRIGAFCKRQAVRVGSLALLGIAWPVIASQISLTIIQALIGYIVVVVVGVGATLVLAPLFTLRDAESHERTSKHLVRAARCLVFVWVSIADAFRPRGERATIDPDAILSWEEGRKSDDRVTSSISVITTAQVIASPSGARADDDALARLPEPTSIRAIPASAGQQEGGAATEPLDIAALFLADPDDSNGSNEKVRQ